MPLYTYICETCAFVCDQFHGMNEQSKPCQECGSSKLQRLPQSVTVKQSSDTGKIVKEFIELSKEEIKKEKEKLSKQEYKK